MWISEAHANKGKVGFGLSGPLSGLDSDRLLVHELPLRII